MIASDRGLARRVGVVLGCLAGGVVAVLGPPGVPLAVVVALLALGALVGWLRWLARRRALRQWREMPDTWRPQRHATPSQPARLSGPWWAR